MMNKEDLKQMIPFELKDKKDISIPTIQKNYKVGFKTALEIYKELVKK